MEKQIISYVEVPDNYWVISKPKNIEIEYINSEEE